MKQRMRTDFFKNGAVQPSGRGEVGLNRLLTRKGENAVGSIPTRSPNLTPCGSVNRARRAGTSEELVHTPIHTVSISKTLQRNSEEPQCFPHKKSATQAGCVKTGTIFGTSSACDAKQAPALAKPGNFYRYLTITLSSILIILIPVWGDFGLPGWVAWIGTITFFVGLRQSFIDYQQLIDNRYTVQHGSAGVTSLRGCSPLFPAAPLPGSHTFGSLGNKAPFSTSEGK